MRPNLLPLVWLFASWMLITCNRQEFRHINFNKTYAITGDTILTRALNTAQLFVANDYLIAAQSTGDYLLKVYDAKSFEELGQFASRGNSVNEFPTALIVDRCIRCGDGECIWVHDLNKGELVKINVSKTLLTRTMVITEKVSTRTESRFHTAFYIDSTLVIGRSTNSTPQMNRLQIYNPRLDVIIRTVGLFPKVDRDRNDLDFLTNKYNTLYVSSIGLKGDETKIASAMCAFDRIDIFKINGDLEKSVFNGVEIPDLTTEYLEANDSHGLQLYYAGIFTSNRYIYGLYYGQLYSDYGRKPIPTQIRIFDWNGNALSKINVSDYLYSFTVDEKKGVMYGVDIFNKRILKYNIKQILNEL